MKFFKKKRNNTRKDRLNRIENYVTRKQKAVKDNFKLIITIILNDWISYRVISTMYLYIINRDRHKSDLKIYINKLEGISDKKKCEKSYCIFCYKDKRFVRLRSKKAGSKSAPNGCRSDEHLQWTLKQRNTIINDIRYDHGWYPSGNDHRSSRCILRGILLRFQWDFVWRYGIVSSYKPQKDLSWNSFLQWLSAF
jgi:hypothetical protein